MPRYSCCNISDVRWLPPLQVARSKLVSVVGVNPPSDIASGRIAEMRKRNMSCFAWRASRSKNAEAFLNPWKIIRHSAPPFISKFRIYFFFFGAGRSLYIAWNSLVGEWRRFAENIWHRQSSSPCHRKECGSILSCFFIFLIISCECEEIYVLR